MASNSPTMLALPPFRGAVRRLLLLAVGCFFVLLMLSRTPLYPTLMGWFALWPETVLHHPWQVFTYAFTNDSLPSALLAMLSVWFFGSTLESEQGAQWFTEYFVVTSVGGGALAAVLALLHIFGMGSGQFVTGLWPFTLALVFAFARFHPETPVRFNFILELKAKYLAAIYLLVYLAMALRGGDRMGATTAICAALCGFLYIRLVPRRGLGFVASERLYGMRNAYYRSRRQRAAKKFTVYMRKQGKDVNLDPSGKYVSLDDERTDPGNPNDKRWMN